MKKYFIQLALFAAVLFFVHTSIAQILPPGVVLKVVIIRHGEKPDSGNNLSMTGFERSLALPAVLDTVTGKPDFTYVPKMSMGTKTSGVRMFQLVSPFAIKDNLVINTSFKEDQDSAAANDVLTRKGVVLMVWEHTNIPPLTKELVGKKLAGIVPKKWEGCDFESIWILEFVTDKKNKLKLSRFYTEQENIFVLPTCPKPKHIIYP